HLRDHCFIVADDAIKQRLAGLQLPNQVAAHLFLDRGNLIAARLELAESAGVGHGLWFRRRLVGQAASLAMLPVDPQRGNKRGRLPYGDGQPVPVRTVVVSCRKNGNNKGQAKANWVTVTQARPRWAPE